MAVEFIDTMNSKLKAGHTAFLLSFNTDDRYFEAGKDKTPLPLNPFIASKFPDHDVAYFNMSTGLRPIIRPGDTKKSAFEISSAQSANSISHALSIVRGGANRILIFGFMDFLAPNASPEMLHPDTMRIIEYFAGLSQSDELRKLNSFVIGVAYTKAVQEIIRKTWCHINIPLPDEDLRKAYYELLSDKPGFAKLDTGITDAEYAALSRGCRLKDIENIMRQAHGESRSVSREDFNAVRQSTLNSLVGDMLVIRQPSGLTLDDIYGMDDFKSYIRSMVRAVKSGKHSLLPTGIFMQGPPGTGKTYLIDPIAKEFGYDILEYSNPKDSYVGQSEENIDNVIQSIKSNNPVLVSVDEADQILSQRQEGPSGDSGISAYIFARILTVMGDPSLRGRVIWVLCSNRPDICDPSLVDRIGLCVPILRPTKTSIPGLIVSLSKQMDINIEASDKELCKVTELLPNEVSIRKLKDLLGLAALNSDGKVTAKDLLFAVDNLLFNEDQTKIAYWTCLAVRMATYSSLLPWMDGKNVISENIPSCLRDIVDPKTGRCDAIALDKRIYELRSMIGG